MNIDLSKYKVIGLQDCYDEDLDNIILLNEKHNTKDFQKAIYNAKEKHREDIEINGDDWYYISQELEDFDYIELGCFDEYVEY